MHLAWAEGSNVRLMALIGYVVLVLASWLEVSAIELALLLLAIALVLVAEMLNTAIEATIDLVVNQYHPLAKKAKDIAAGGVLAASGIALAVGIVVFLPHLAEVPSAIREHLEGRRPGLLLTLGGVAVLGWCWLASLRGRAARIARPNRSNLEAGSRGRDGGAAGQDGVRQGRAGRGGL